MIGREKKRGRGKRDKVRDGERGNNKRTTGGDFSTLPLRMFSAALLRSAPVSLPCPYDEHQTQKRKEEGKPNSRTRAWTRRRTTPEAACATFRSAGARTGPRSPRRGPPPGRSGGRRSPWRGDEVKAEVEVEERGGSLTDCSIYLFFAFSCPPFRSHVFFKRKQHGKRER